MSLFHSPNIRKQNLVFHVDAANTKSYPGSGNAWSDLSLTKATANLTNVASLIQYSSANKGSFTFTGSGYFDCGQPNLQLTTYNQATVLIFCKIDQYNGDDTQKAFGVDPLFNLQPNFRTTDNSGRIEFYLNGAWRSASLGNLFTFNTWDCYAGSYDGSNIRLYKNGALVSTTAFASGTFSNYGGANLRIGDMGNNGKYFDGNISIASVYNRALSDAEIKQYYEVFRGRY